MAIPLTQVERAQQIAAKKRAGTITMAQASYLLGHPKLDVMSPAVIASLPSLVENVLGRVGYSHPFMFIFGNYRKFNQPADFGDGYEQTVLPVAPESVEYSLKNNAQSFVAMSGKTFTHAGPEDLLRISFESFIPTGLTRTTDENLPSYVYNQAKPASTSSFSEPKDFVQMFQDAQVANQPFYFSIVQSQSTANGNILIDPIPMTVVDFSPSYTAGQGTDIKFSMTLQKWNPQGQNVTTGTQLYTTRAGDKFSCGNIAARELGDTSRYAEIKKLNLKILTEDHEKRVRQKAAGLSVRTDFITPGLLLTLPLRKANPDPNSLRPPLDTEADFNSLRPPI